MGKVRYIGSKARIVRDIMRLIGSPSNGGTFVDVFAGTGVVSREAALWGWNVKANDHLVSSSLVTVAGLLSARDVPFSNLGGYRNVLAQLQMAPPREGFVFREYTPSGQSRGGQERLYFSQANGAKIDGLRAQIEQWNLKGWLSSAEKSLLLADLLGAANAVANIAGTYGCFLSYWSDAALKPLQPSPRELLPSPVQFQVSTRDAFEVECQPEDVVYLDPPYTKRQYAAYYHLLETIAVGDEPLVEGVTGLRPWEEKASPFCYKSRALDALVRWIRECRAERIFLSYSSEGHVELDALHGALKGLVGIDGSVKVHALAKIDRYRPNVAAHQGASQVTEYLLEIEHPVFVLPSLEDAGRPKTRRHSASTSGREVLAL